MTSSTVALPIIIPCGRFRFSRSPNRRTKTVEQCCEYLQTEI